ncbi:hypothetical protein [Paraburkholderia xenovorans]|uniref:hypothetical protein n=1 Tax=Paraburkholderia xenovorans TaxID=36873 RepID=UPI0038BD4E67
MGTALERVLPEAVRGVRPAQFDFPETPVNRMPFYPPRQVGAGLTINWYRLRDALGYPA